MKPTTVAICRDCWEQDEGFYLPVEEAGTDCPMEHDLDYGKPARKLIKRRLYICDLPNHCEKVGYATVAALQAHQAEGA